MAAATAGDGEMVVGRSNGTGAVPGTEVRRRIGLRKLGPGIGGPYGFRIGGVGCVIVGILAKSHDSRRSRDW